LKDVDEGLLFSNFECVNNLLLREGHEVETMNSLSLFVIVLLASLAAISLTVFIAANPLSVMAKDSGSSSGDSGGDSDSNSNGNSNGNSDPVQS
jgi:hypothetical protein